jgi:hypothetical protein
MTPASPNEPTPSLSDRPVLIWNPDTDASRVSPSVEAAADSLNVPVESVLAAISSGDLLEGWFVDWQAPGAST